jgi:hypothetical protein
LSAGFATTNDTRQIGPTSASVAPGVDALAIGYLKSKFSARVSMVAMLLGALAVAALSRTGLARPIVVADLGVGVAVILTHLADHERRWPPVPR